MKMKFEFLFVILFLLLFFKCTTNKPLIFKNDNYFLVKKIDSLDNVYIIYIERNDSIFKIVSKRESNNCKPIQVGKYYLFKLKSVFPDNFGMKLDVGGVRVYNTNIELEDDSVVWDLFITENLDGLCYIKRRKIFRNKSD